MGPGVYAAATKGYPASQALPGPTCGLANGPEFIRKLLSWFHAVLQKVWRFTTQHHILREVKVSLVKNLFGGHNPPGEKKKKKEKQ